jgi:hypothetical protein
MTRFDGTAARQLDLIDLTDRVEPVKPHPVTTARSRPNLRLLKHDVYAELVRRRRRAQIAARHALERADGQ